MAWNITQVPIEDVHVTEIEPHRLINAARALDCRGLVYTHSEPALNLEFYAEVMGSARAKGLTNVLATNGLLSLEAFEKVADNLDAVALTVKGDESFYRDICGLRGNGIEKHLTRLVDAVAEKGVHLEIVSLVIPGHEEQSRVGFEYARRTSSPIIFLRFIPCHVMDDTASPNEALMEDVLNEAYGEGLRYAYVENIFSHPGKVTYCSHCRAPIVRREGYGVVEWGLVDGRCMHCGAKVPIVGEKA